MVHISVISALYPSRSQAAKAFGVTAEALRKWEQSSIPPGRCHQAVRLAAQKGLVITVHDLRPDFFGPAPGIPPAVPSPEPQAA